MSNPKKQLGNGLESRVVQKASSKGLKSSRQPLSGVLKDYPNDCQIENILVECKVRTTTLPQSGHRFLTLDMEWKDKVEANAKKAGFDYGIVVVNEKGSRKPLVLLDFDRYLDLVAKLNQYETK